MKMQKTPVECHPNGYPIEVVARAKWELEVFERVASDTAEELIAEVEKLRRQIEEIQGK